MKKIMLAASLAALLGGAAIAQTGPKGSTSGGVSSGSVPQAPVGHRQPRASDVPSKIVSDPNDPLSKENQALDKKIKSICRGC
ncbi:hypothetical protein [Bradyrhizobium sp. RDT46]|uniref:hypothetical protein n=1 Tax=Bradyrhizobium sp. RDT46 TaxID=3341829 RepID=UPI0035C67998